MRALLVATLVTVSVPVAAQPPTVPDAFTALREATDSGDAPTIEGAVTAMIAAVDAAPDHPDATIGLSNAAHALARIGRWSSAERLWERVVDEGTPRLGPGTQLRAAAVVDALALLARRSAERGEWDRAADRYRTIADSARFRRMDSPGMHERIVEALNGAADALEHQGDYGRAARYALRAAERDLPELAGPERLDHAAELFIRAGDWAEAVRTSERILQLYGRQRLTVGVIMRARVRIVRSLERRGARLARVRAARLRMLTDFERLEGSPGSEAAELAAKEALALVPPAREGIVARGGSERARIRSFERSLASAVDRLASAIEGYEQVLGYRSAESSLAALVAIGDRSAALAAAVEGARVPAAVREGPARDLRCRALRSYRAAASLAAAAQLSLPATAASAVDAAGPADGCDP